MLNENEVTMYKFFLENGPIESGRLSGSAIDLTRSLVEKGLVIKVIKVHYNVYQAVDDPQELVRAINANK